MTDHKIVINPGDTVTVSVAATAPPPVTPPPPTTGGLTLPLPAGMKVRPYAATGPWNTPIPSGPVLDPNSASWVSGIGPLTSNRDGFTFPFYAAPGGTPKVTFAATGSATVISADGKTATAAPNKQIAIPLPAGATPASGSDAQILVVDLATGDEYDMWQVDVANRKVTNMTVFRAGVLSPGTTTARYPSRGAGIVYLGGLIRPWEVAQGHIDHALAFAYDKVSPAFRAPATKSDGKGGGLPEGARLQLDPSYDISGLTGTGRIIAKALQVYGAYVIDYAGNPGKIYAEYQSTAKWGVSDAPALATSTVSPIPANRLRVLRQWDGR